LAQGECLRAIWSARKGDLLVVPDTSHPRWRATSAAAPRWHGHGLHARGAGRRGRAVGCHGLMAIAIATFARIDTQRRSGTHRSGAIDRGPVAGRFAFRSLSTIGTVLSRLHLKHMNVLNSCRRPWSGSGVRLTSIMLAPQALHFGRFISRKATSRSVMCKRSVTACRLTSRHPFCNGARFIVGLSRRCDNCVLWTRALLRSYHSGRLELGRAASTHPATPVWTRNPSDRRFGDVRGADRIASRNGAIPRAYPKLVQDRRRMAEVGAGFRYGLATGLMRSQSFASQQM
jgi:hypothetical protein